MIPIREKVAGEKSSGINMPFHYSGGPAVAVPPAGLEPAAHCLEGSCSFQLSYGGLRTGT